MLAALLLPHRRSKLSAHLRLQCTCVGKDEAMSSMLGTLGTLEMFRGDPAGTGGA